MNSWASMQKPPQKQERWFSRFKSISNHAHHRVPGVKLPSCFCWRAPSNGRRRRIDAQAGSRSGGLRARRPAAHYIRTNRRHGCTFRRRGRSNTNSPPSGGRAWGAVATLFSRTARSAGGRAAATRRPVAWGRRTGLARRAPPSKPTVPTRSHGARPLKRPWYARAGSRPSPARRTPGLTWPATPARSCGRRPSAGRAPYLLRHLCGSSPPCKHRPPGARTCRWKPSLAARRAPGGRRPPSLVVGAAVPGAAGRGGACRGDCTSSTEAPRRRGGASITTAAEAAPGLVLGCEREPHAHRASVQRITARCSFCSCHRAQFGCRSLLLQQLSLVEVNASVCRYASCVSLTRVWPCSRLATGRRARLAVCIVLSACLKQLYTWTLSRKQRTLSRK